MHITTTTKTLDPLKVGQLIEQKRKEKNWTQEELGHKVLVTRKAISKWEAGRSVPNIDMACNLSRVFDITLDELLSGEARTIVTKKEPKFFHFFSNIRHKTKKKSHTMINFNFHWNWTWNFKNKTINFGNTNITSDQTDDENENN